MPNVTAAAPNTIAAAVTRVLAGRANGAASPRVSALGADCSRASARWAKYPCAGLGARPAAIACTALIRPAREAGAIAPATVSARAPSGTAASTQSGTVSVPTW
jgi:hypothetical protein